MDLSGHAVSLLRCSVFGRLSGVPAPKPEPSLWWSLYGGEATKTLGVYCQPRLFLESFLGVGGTGRQPLKSGHAVQRKRCGSLNRSFSYWEAARSLRPPTLTKRLLEPRRPLVGAFRRSSGVRPSPAGFRFFREIVLRKWSGCLAGHWGERFQAKFWD